MSKKSIFLTVVVFRAKQKVMKHTQFTRMRAKIMKKVSVLNTLNRIES